jgi:mRNA interferase MazF
MQKENNHIYRGEIYFADLSPVIGSEQGGVRPVLVLQNNVGNRYSPTLIVAAITARHKKSLPTHVEIQGIDALSKRSVALLEQIRTIDRSRLRERVGSLNNQAIGRVDEALKVSVGLCSPHFNFEERISAL